MRTTSMLDDKRAITAVYFNDEEGGCYRVGHLDCTSIEVYGEPSEHCFVPYVAVYHSENLITRIPAGMVQIMYAQQEHGS